MYIAPEKTFKGEKSFMISIIITYYTGLNILQSNLSLLLQNLEHDIDTEIIIVNDNPDASLPSEKLPASKKIKIVNMPQNGGYAAACNYGTQFCSGELLIFMDSDILVARGWLTALLTAYHSTADCGAVSATILNLNKKEVVHWGLGMNKGIEVIKPFRDGKLPANVKKGTFEFNMATSGCILIPKDVFFQVGKFDEKFYNGFCDLDLTYKITHLGFKCIYCSDAIVYHRGKVSGTTRLAAEDDTRALFVRKWAEELPDDGINLLSMLYSLNINFKSKNEYILINFSRSLFAQEYHQVLLQCLTANQLNYYEFKNQASLSVTLEDFLPWSICGINIPIIYFADNITAVRDNHHWYMHRVGKGDIIADRNGNLLLTDSLSV